MWKTVVAVALGGVAGFVLARATDAARPVAPARDARTPRAADESPGPATDAPARPRRVGPAPATRVGNAVAAEPTTADAASAPVRNASDRARSLLDAIRAELAAPVPGDAGITAFRRAQEYAELPDAPPVPLELIRSLFARGGHFPNVARTLFRFADPVAAASELGTILADPRAAWPTGEVAVPRDEILTGLLVRGASQVADGDVRTLLRSESALLRTTALELALARGLVAPDELLRFSREDRDEGVRARALTALVARANAGGADRPVVVAEVLRAAHDPASPLHEAAIHLLGELGPDGVDAAAEVLTAGGLPVGLVDSVARGLAARGRIDVLARAQVTGEALDRLLGVVEDALHREPPVVSADVVATTLRSMPVPDSADAARTYFRLALQAGAADLPLGAAKRSDLAADIRAIAVSAHFSADATLDPVAVVAAARAVLVDAPVPATTRREFLEQEGPALVGVSDAGRALVARIAESDPDPWVRRAASHAIRDAAR